MDLIFARERHETACCAVTKVSPLVSFVTGAQRRFRVLSCAEKPERECVCARKARNAARCAASRKSFCDGERSEPFSVFRAQKMFLLALFASLAANAFAVEKPVRLATYNINYCNNNKVGSAAVAAAIKEIDPDFIALNEVSISGSYDSGQNQAEIIAASNGLVVAGYTDVKYGNALLSKTAPLSAETITLNMSTNGWGTRYCTICEFTNYYVAVTHLDTQRYSGTDAFNEVQASNAVAFATMKAKFATCSKPVFLCGDWNTRPTWGNMAVATDFLEILSPTNGVATYHGSSGTSSLILDYISLTKDDADGFIVSDAYVVDDRVTSDHAPVVVEFYRKTPASEIDEWMNESMLTTGATGSWSPGVTYDVDTFKAELSGTNVFAAASASAGTPVTVTVTTEMSSFNEEQSDPDSAAQAAIRLGTNGVFQVWTSSGWLDTTTSGANYTEYTLQVIFNYKAAKYSVLIYDADSGVWVQMSAEDGAKAFSLANTTVSSLSSVVFAGETVFTSLYGTYVEITGFSENDTLILKDNASAILTAAQAAWLNKCTNGTDDVATVASGLSAEDFANAYLLNLDISQGTGYSFEITDIAKDSASVTLSVTLTRDGKVEQAVNGTLKFYTSADLKTYTEAGSATLSDDDFSAGDTATATIDIDEDGNGQFYKAVIE